MSTFDLPCTTALDTTGKPLLDSEFQFVPPNATSIPEFSITLTGPIQPLWFYCRQAGWVLIVKTTAITFDRVFAGTARAEWSLL